MVREHNRTGHNMDAAPPTFTVDNPPPAGHVCDPFAELLGRPCCSAGLQTARVEAAEAEAQIEAERNPTRYNRPCRKCDGFGTLQQYLYHQHGVCFRCAGTGVDPR